MANTPQPAATAASETQTRWGIFVALGIGLLIVAAIAFANLVAATVASVLLIGAMMLVGGVIEIAHAFKVRSWSRFFLWLASGLLYAVAGLIAFSNPLLASAALTLVLAISLIIAGICRIWVAFEARHHEGWGWIAATGVLTLLAGLIIATGWPITSLWFLGLMLAFDLAFQGCGFLVYGLALRKRL